MTQAPYADDLPEPRRLSGLAVASLVFGLLCCIPGSGLIGVILGGAGLVKIGRSEGRLSGRGMALAGIILGLLGTLLYLGGTLGLMATLNGLNIYGDVAAAIDKGDHGSVRAMLSPATAGAISDEEIDRFAQRVRDEWGAYRGLPKGLPAWVSGYGQIGQLIDRSTSATGTQRIPLPLHYDRGTAAGFFLYDPTSTGTRGAATVSNLAISAKDGTLMWLVDPKATGTPRSPPARPEAPTGPGGASGGTG